MERRKTYIIDVDGTVLVKHSSSASEQWSYERDPELCPGVLEFLDAVEKEGACIVLITARRESCRRELEYALRALGVYWDHLVMGAGNGERVVINDGPVSAVEVPKNGGLK